MKKLEYCGEWQVICPVVNKSICVADCADYCDYYEGDGKDEDGVLCSYEK